MALSKALRDKISAVDVEGHPVGIMLDGETDEDRIQLVVDKMSAIFDVPYHHSEGASVVVPTSWGN